jgi:hypothetical protein
MSPWAGQRRLWKGNGGKHHFISPPIHQGPKVKMGSKGLNTTVIIVLTVTLSSCFFRLVYVCITSISKVFATKHAFYTEMHSDICDSLVIPNYSWTFSLLFFRLVKDKQLLISLHLCHNLNKYGYHTSLEYCYISVSGPHKNKSEVAEYTTMTKHSIKFYKNEKQHNITH